MSDTPPPESEVEEGSPFGGPECEESSPEPSSTQVAADEEDEEIVENLNPIENLAVEFYEDADDTAEANNPDTETTTDPKIENQNKVKVVETEISAEIPEVNYAIDDTAKVPHTENQNMEELMEAEIDSAEIPEVKYAVDDTATVPHTENQNREELMEAEISAENNETFDDSNMDADATDPTANIEDPYNTFNSIQESFDPDYKDLQKTYIEDFIYSNAPSTYDESSNSNFDDGKEETKGSPLLRFSKIVKAVEIAEYETLQVLYQLLYQRSAWDTQEILAQRILEFSGFNFSQNSEEFFHREMMLRTQTNEVLIKLGAILGLDQVQKMLLDMDKARHGLIQGIMTFLYRPSKKTRNMKNYVPGNLKTSANDDDQKKVASSNLAKCRCRNMCWRKFSKLERKAITDYVKELDEKNLLDSYLVQMIELRKIIRLPGTYEDSKKLKEVTYSYKVKCGSKEVIVCKGSFLATYGLSQSKILQLQNKLKTGKDMPPEININDFPPMPVVVSVSKKKEENRSIEPKIVSPRKRNRPGPKCSKKWISSEEQVRRLEADAQIDIKSNIGTQKVVPKIVLEKIDVKSLDVLNNKLIDESKKSPLKENAHEFSEVKQENMQLKDFPLVVKAIENAPEELLIDVHFLLFLSSADVDKVKENILEFGGFSFDSDTEEYDERIEFLQRMSFKIVSDVARSFSLATLSNKEDTIKNILNFLSKPDESFLRVSAALPLSLSDVELDDLGDLSDSDVSITCEVVEKKVECIDLLSSGEDSDREDRPRKDKTPQKSGVAPKTSATNSIMKSLLSKPNSESAAPSQPTVVSLSSCSKEGKRTLRNFETICKIVNTHPHEYLVDIFDLLYLKKHEPTTLRSDILDFSGFAFEKGTPEYVKRKQLLDRMLYNSVRRIYNTLIHNTTEVKVFSKPTMITEIFQFLFKLPDHDTSVRPPPTAKPVTRPSFMQPLKNLTGAVTMSSSPLINQTGKLSDLKRVFQRVACFPCEYLIDVHKLLFMTDCDQKVIRQNIFAFKGFPFSPESQEFQQRKMYLEYLTFHSLRKISSVLTTRSVDLRNSTKHELATHLTQVLAEYCSTTPNENEASESGSATVSSSATSTVSSPAVETIVVTPIIDPSITGMSTVEPSKSPVSTATVITSTSTDSAVNVPPKTQATSQPLAISILDARSVNSPSVTTTTASRKRTRRKRTTPVAKGNQTKQGIKQAEVPSQFPDINLPEVEQYRHLYGQNLNIYPSSGPTITGISAFNAGGMVPQVFTQIVPQTLSFPVTYSQVQTPFSAVQQPNQLIGINQTLAPKIVTQVPSNQSEIIVPGECLNDESEEPASKKAKSVTASEAIAKKSSEETNSFHSKIRDGVTSDEDEDCDKPLSSLVGHPIDSVLKKHVVDIVEQSNLQTITINGVIQKIFNMYPKFDLSYRKEFLKSTLRSMLYRLGQDKSSKTKVDQRDTDSPDCSVTTTENCDSVSESPKAMDCGQ